MNKTEGVFHNGVERRSQHFELMKLNEGWSEQWTPEDWLKLFEPEPETTPEPDSSGSGSGRSVESEASEHLPHASRMGVATIRRKEATGNWRKHQAK